MNAPNTTTITKRWTASELRQLPSAERDTIIAAAAALAEPEYRNNLELTAFDAFGKDDLHVDSFIQSRER